jgi:hypothetical protein
MGEILDGQRHVAERRGQLAFCLSAVDLTGAPATSSVAAGAMG